MLDSKRIQTMRLRLGKVSEMIKTDKFLPFFRNRQINHPEEFEKSVEIASRKRDPQRYLATVWKESNIEKSLRWLRSIIMDSVAKARELTYRKSVKILKQKEELYMNKENRRRLIKMYENKQIFSLRR